MLKLMVGVKGTGKTKTLIERVNLATTESNGSVVCIEKGNKLTYDISHKCRLIDTEEFFITDADALYGMIAGILASNHDVTHVFVDSALKICGNDSAAFDRFLVDLERLLSGMSVECMMTASIPVEDISETMKKHLM